MWAGCLTAWQELLNHDIFKRRWPYRTSPLVCSSPACFPYWCSPRWSPCSVPFSSANGGLMGLLARCGTWLLLGLSWSSITKSWFRSGEWRACLWISWPIISNPWLPPYTLIFQWAHQRSLEAWTFPFSRGRLRWTGRLELVLCKYVGLRGTYLKTLPSLRHR